MSKMQVDSGNAVNVIHGKDDPGQAPEMQWVM